MDKRKIDEIVARERPKHKKLESYDDEESLMASDEDRDVDVKNLPVSAWKQQPAAAPPREPYQAGDERKPSTRKKAGGSSLDELRARFRPRKLGSPSGDADAPARRRSRPETGKIALRRLRMGSEDADTDASMDVLVDEDDGIIGESDSVPENHRKIGKRKKK